MKYSTISMMITIKLDLSSMKADFYRTAEKTFNME